MYLVVLSGYLHVIDMVRNEKVDLLEDIDDKLKGTQHVHKFLPILKDIIFALAYKMACSIS